MPMPMGHLHSVDVKENNLMIVEQHRTLAAPDAYAARGGWISGRDAKVITYHKISAKLGESRSVTTWLQNRRILLTFKES